MSNFSGVQVLGLRSTSSLRRSQLKDPKRATQEDVQRQRTLRNINFTTEFMLQFYLVFIILFCYIIIIIMHNYNYIIIIMFLFYKVQYDSYDSNNNL